MSGKRWLKWLPPTLESVKSVHFKFDPLDYPSRGTKQALHLFVSRNMQRTNLKCAITHEFVNPIVAPNSPYPSPESALKSPVPSVTYNFKDGSTFIYPSKAKKCDDILFAFALHSEYLSNKKALGEAEDLVDDEDEEKK